MPLTRTSCAGCDSEGRAMNAAMISSRVSSLIQSESSGLASPNTSALSFCCSLFLVTTALRAHASQARIP